MKENQKKAIVVSLGVIGTIVLLLGFTDLYKFLYGLAAAVGIWILTGMVALALGLKKEKTKKAEK